MRRSNWIYSSINEYTTFYTYTQRKGVNIIYVWSALCQIVSTFKTDYAALKRNTVVRLMEVLVYTGDPQVDQDVSKHFQTTEKRCGKENLIMSKRRRIIWFHHLTSVSAAFTFSGNVLYSRRILFHHSEQLNGSISVSLTDSNVFRRLCVFSLSVKVGWGTNATEEQKTLISRLHCWNKGRQCAALNKCNVSCSPAYGRVLHYGGGKIFRYCTLKWVTTTEKRNIQWSERSVLLFAEFWNVSSSRIASSWAD